LRFFFSSHLTLSHGYLIPSDVSKSSRPPLFPLDFLSLFPICYRFLELQMPGRAPIPADSRFLPLYCPKPALMRYCPLPTDHPSHFPLLVALQPVRSHSDVFYRRSLSSLCFLRCLKGSSGVPVEAVRPPPFPQSSFSLPARCASTAPGTENFPFFFFFLERGKQRRLSLPEVVFFSFLSSRWTAALRFDAKHVIYFFLVFVPSFFRNIKEGGLERPYPLFPSQDGLWEQAFSSCPPPISRM